MGRFKEYWRARPELVAGSVIGLLCLVRLVAVIATPLELAPDEGQYWRWGQSFDWGYYSKPPLIAWVIGLSTTVFGQTEWAIRLVSPLAHGVAGFCLFLLGRRMFDARIGAWAAGVYLLMPGVWLSSTLMSTDALLLPLWSLSLWALWRLRCAPGFGNAVLLGAALGAAMLAKYAALYFLLGAGLASLVDPDTRRALLSLWGLVALAAMAAILSPNLLWNAANDFATVGHTGDNANWENATFDPGHIVKFIVDQFGVFGPVTFGLLVAATIFAIRSRVAGEPRRELWLLCFILPPLLIILVQAFVSRAHANWAATAYPAASVLVAALIARPMIRPWLVGGIALNAIIGCAYLLLALAPGVANALGADNAFKRARGWDEMTIQLAEIAAEQNATAIMFDEREPWHGADFYGLDVDMPPIRMWRSLPEAQNFAEETGVLAPGEDRRILFAVTVPAYRERIAADFASFEPIGDLEIPIGPDRVRRLGLFLASGFDPVARDAAYFDRFPLNE